MSDRAVNSSSEYLRVEIMDVAANELDACLKIEAALREDRPAAPRQGFLLSGGDSPETYSEFARYGAFKVAKVDGVIAGFAFALPPDSPRMQKIRESSHRFQLHDEQQVFEIRPLAWMAKVGVMPDFMGKGIATQLYRSLFQQFPDWYFLTTTVRDPIRNIASERLHVACGFRQIGQLPLGNRGTLQNVMCSVWYRPPRPLD